MADQNAWVKITEYERHVCESMVDRDKQSYTYCNQF